MTNCILNAKKFYYPKENFQDTIEFGLEFALETETEDLKSLLFWRLRPKIRLGTNSKMEKNKVI